MVLGGAHCLLSLILVMLAFYFFKMDMVYFLSLLELINAHYKMFQMTLKNVKKNSLSSEHPEIVTVHIFNDILF